MSLESEVASAAYPTVAYYRRPPTT